MSITRIWIAGAGGRLGSALYHRDLAYHVMVLMVASGISLDEIKAELASRHVIDHKVKQEKMASDFS